MEGIQDGVRRESTSAVELMLGEFRDKEFRDKGEESYGADRWGLLLQPTDKSTVATVAPLTALIFLHLSVEPFMYIHRLKSIGLVK